LLAAVLVDFHLVVLGLRLAVAAYPELPD